MNELIKKPEITQKELASIIGKSERTIKTRTVEMQEKGLICRENGKRNGKWKVLYKLQLQNKAAYAFIDKEKSECQNGNILRREVKR